MLFNNHERPLTPQSRFHPPLSSEMGSRPGTPFDEESQIARTNEAAAAIVQPQASPLAPIEPKKELKGTVPHHVLTTRFVVSSLTEEDLQFSNSLKKTLNLKIHHSLLEMYDSFKQVHLSYCTYKATKEDLKKPCPPDNPKYVGVLYGLEDSCTKSDYIKNRNRIIDALSSRTLPIRYSRFAAYLLTLYLDLNKEIEEKNWPTDKS